MDCSLPGFPVLHYLPELAQTHVHWLGDTIQLSHPLLSPFPAAFNPSQHHCLFVSGGQSTGPSASASVLPMNIQGWFPFGLTELISLLSKGLSRVFSSTTIQKHQFFGTQLSLWSNSHICTWLLEKPKLWQYGPLSAKSLLFNMLSAFVTAFLLRSKHLLILCLQPLSAVIFEPKKIKSVTVSVFSPIYLPWSDANRCHDLRFLDVEF